MATGEKEVVYITCTICGADNTKLLFEGRDEWFNLPGTFPVHQCTNCGLIYINPQPSPSAIAKYYPDKYTPYQPAIVNIPSRLKQWELRYSLHKRVRAIEKRTKQRGRVLDVGCATGNFLAALRERGWATNGIELNAKAAEYARTMQNLKVFTGTLEQATFPEESFDLIIFWDVLEHVYLPRQNLETAARLTKPGGSLIVTLPNPDSVDAKLFGGYWAGWDIPRHLQIFSLPVIKQLLDETRWEMSEMFCMSGRHWLFNLSLEHFLNHHVKSKFLRHLILTIARSYPIRILTLPYFALIEKMKKGSVMVIFARRK